MVFISYSSKDYNIANQIRGLLQKENIHCWMAPESIPIGSDYATEIPLAINNCDYFILVLSKNSQQSIYVPKELDIAISQKKMVFPLNIDASLLEPNFRLLLTNIQSIDASMKFEEVIQYVANRIRNRIEATENSDFAFNEAERQSNVRSESPYNLNKGHLNIGNYDGKHLRKNDNIDSARKKSIFGEMNIRKAFVFSIIALGLSFPAVWIYILKYDFNLFLRIIYFCGLLFITYLFHDKVETNRKRSIFSR